MEKLLVSPSPHLHTKTSTKSLMRDVVIAMMPAVIVSVLFYGWSELLVLGVSVASCVLLEYLITKFLLKKPWLQDLPEFIRLHLLICLWRKR